MKFGCGGIKLGRISMKWNEQDYQRYRNEERENRNLLIVLWFLSLLAMVVMVKSNPRVGIRIYGSDVHVSDKGLDTVGKVHIEQYGDSLIIQVGDK